MPTEQENDGLPADVHIGNMAVAVAHRLRAKGSIIILWNDDETISFCGHGMSHAKANELLSLGIHINLTQHDEAVRNGAAGAEAREVLEMVDARNKEAA